MDELVIHMSTKQIQEVVATAAAFAERTEAKDGVEEGTIKTNNALAGLLLAGCREWMETTSRG